MDLQNLIKETEKLGVIVLKTHLPESKGRHSEYNGLKIIYLHDKLSDIEAINVLLHERAHFLNQDYNNSLAYIPTYSHKIEHEAETNRIIDFLSLINDEYPIDETFNYIDFMKHANIPSKFEKLVRETAHKIYNSNIKKKNFI